MKFLLVWLLAGIIEVTFIKGEQPRWRAGHSYPRPLPQEIMVDAVNYIGLVLLQAHNQNNENNIALSPYGATSVLVALGEGVQGTALDEILQATLLPLDVSVTRVGLRDIHRHLKEGFLAGLTFSHENVTLKSSYEDILRFYGYDVDSFNNALYPDPYSTTTNIGSESSTQSLSSVSDTANFSSSTTQTLPITSSSITLPNTLEPQTAETTPSTVTVPSTVTASTTIENRNDLNSSESSTIETTQIVTDSIGSTTTHTTQVTNIASTAVETSQMTTTVGDLIPESTSANTVVTSTLTGVASTQTVTTTSTVPVTTTSTTTTTTVATPITTTIPSESTTTSTVTTATPSTIPAASDQPTTFNDGITAGTTSTGTTNSTQTSVPETTIPTTAVSSSSTSTTSAPTTAYISSVSTNQESSFSPTPGSTIKFTTPVSSATTTTAIPLTTTITQSTRPTAITVSVVPSTVGDVNDGTTAGTTTTAAPTTIYSTGPIVVNLQPTTIAGSSTVNSDTESAAVTETISTTTTVPTTVAISTTGTSVTENAPSTTIVSSTLNTQSTTLNSNSEPTPFTIDLVPSTLGTASTPSDSTTGNPIPALITPLGNSTDGFQIDVRPSTVQPKTGEIAIAESEKNKRMVTNKNPKKNPLPRFRDNTELVRLLKSQNTSAVMPNTVEKNLMSQSNNPKNSVSDKKKAEVESTTLIKNNKDIIIDASIAKSSTNHTLPPTIKNTNDEHDFENDGVLTESEYNTQLNYLANETYMGLYDKDVIIVNKEADFADYGTAAEIVLSEEETLSEPTVDNQTSSAEDATVYEKTRGTRSVIDYLIARYHDNNPSNMHMSTGSGTDYEPMKPTTFAVNGKIRESNINFMTYDTVLPFRYISYLNALALTFPLDSTKYYLLLILPLDEMGIDNLIANMMSTTLKQIIYHLQPTRVKATIPSFMLKGYVVLTPTLQKLGIRQIFEPRHADFSRMTEDKDIYVTNIEQAVTVTIRNYVDPSTLQNNQHFRRRGPVQFTADHPFLYFVMDSQIHVALMAGKIINPLNSRIR